MFCLLRFNASWVLEALLKVLRNKFGINKKFSQGVMRLGFYDYELLGKIVKRKCCIRQLPDQNQTE